MNNALYDLESKRTTPDLFLVELCTFKGRQTVRMELHLHQLHAQLPPLATDSFILLPPKSKLFFNERKEKRKKTLTSTSLSYIEGGPRMFGASCSPYNKLIHMHITLFNHGWEFNGLVEFPFSFLFFQISNC